MRVYSVLRLCWCANLYPQPLSFNYTQLPATAVRHLISLVHATWASIPSLGPGGCGTKFPFTQAQHPFASSLSSPLGIQTWNSQCFLWTLFFRKSAVLYFFNFTEVYLIYNVSGILQSGSVIQTCVCVCVSLDSFPLQVITRCWLQFPALCSRSLSFICFIHSRVYLLIPNF